MCELRSSKCKYKYIGCSKSIIKNTNLLNGKPNPYDNEFENEYDLALYDLSYYKKTPVYRQYKEYLYRNTYIFINIVTGMPLIIAIGYNIYHSIYKRKIGKKEEEYENEDEDENEDENENEDNDIVIDDKTSFDSIFETNSYDKLISNTNNNNPIVFNSLNDNNSSSSFSPSILINRTNLNLSNESNPTIIVMNSSEIISSNEENLDVELPPYYKEPKNSNSNIKFMKNIKTNNNHYD